MKHHHLRQDWQWAFIDLLLCMFGLFAALCIVTMLQMNPQANKSAVDMKAEYVVTMTWPDKAYDDIDLHMLLPDGRMVNFRTRDAPYATLDRDDLGASSDTYTADGKQKLIEQNRELITIRTIVPGTYVVNVHVFRLVDQITLNGETQTAAAKLPYTARVILQRLNPATRDVATAEVVLTEKGEQKTAFSFTIEPDGSVTNIDMTADLPFIPTRPKTASTSSLDNLLGDLGGDGGP